MLEQLDTYLATERIAQADVPVSLLATAGMRNFRLDDHQTELAILDSSAAPMVAAGYSMRDDRILPAVQEAVLAWADANAMTGGLTNARRSIGIMETGVASAQVPFRSHVTFGPWVRDFPDTPQWTAWYVITLLHS